MQDKPNWWLTEGLARGMTVQFAEGDWRNEIGSSVTLTDEAFELVEPLVRELCTAWTPEHRFGVYELSASERRELAAAFEIRAAYLRQIQDLANNADMFEALAKWLSDRHEATGIVSILGY